MNMETLNTSNGSPFVNCTCDLKITQNVLPILYTVIFVLGIIMNCLSGWIFFHVPTKSAFIVYLKNTVVADIIMILTLPFKILSDSGIGPSQMTAFVCRFSAVIFHESMYINLILLGLIGWDRFVKIVRPYKRNKMDNVSQAKMISVAVWIVIFSLWLPNIILSSENVDPQSSHDCISVKTQLGKEWHKAVVYIGVIIFWVVFISMTLFYTIISKKIYDSYIKSKRKSKPSGKKMRFKVFLVVAVFFLCFAPYHFLRLPYTFSQVGMIKEDCQLQNRLYVAKETTQWIAATNVIMDPLIYVILCRPFRKLIPGFETSTNSMQENLK